MFLRLYFLLPNEQLTKKIISDLMLSGINRRNIHAIVRNKPLDPELPDATQWQKMDINHRIENFAWNSNLLVFGLALFSLIFFISFNMPVFAGISLVIMASTFLLGDLFALLTPRVHLDEFEHALSHGEVLLMIDTPQKHSARIEALITRHHPAAIPAGSCWSINALGI